MGNDNEDHGSVTEQTARESAIDPDEAVSSRPESGAANSTSGSWYNDPDQLLVYACALLIGSAAFSAYDAVSLVAGGTGVALVAPAALVARHHPIVKACAALGVVWVVYGFAVGAMPALNDRTAISDWVSTEGRSLVVIGLAAAMCGLQRVATFRRILSAVVWLISGVSGVTAALYLAGVDTVRGGNLLYGFTTSHHVPGFLASAGMLVLIVQPHLIATTAIRAVAFGSMLAAAVLSGSRTSIIAVLICGAIVVAGRYSIRSIVRPVLAGFVIVGLALAGSSRLRETVEIVTTAEFYRDARISFTSADSVTAVEASSSEAEANILLRFSIWGRAVDQFTASPIIGIGRYRVNDEGPTSVGVEGFVYLVTDAERSLHTDAQPHNQYLYLLAETGLLGLALGAIPFWLAWRRTKPDPGRGSDGDRLLSRMSMLFGALVGVVSAGLLGTGVGLVGMMMIFGGMRAWEVSGPHAIDESRSE
jgi:O-antigen ligase